MKWEAPDRNTVDRSARYLVATNSGSLEIWTGALLYIRMRPEFVVGRAVLVAKIDEPPVAWSEAYQVAGHGRCWLAGCMGAEEAA